MTLEEFGDTLILQNLKPLVSSNPYLAFFIMAGTLEFIARCRCQLEDFHNRDETRKRFVEAIKSINALADYKNLKDEDEDNNKLYSSLRCGLLHAGIPKEGIKLSSGKNDIENNIVGCEDLYEDIKKAWEEIKLDPETYSYITHKDALYINGLLSGGTPVIISQSSND